MHALPYGFKKFSLAEPLPKCGRWKDHMPASRDPAAYHLYIEARKLWRSKIEWQLSHEEAIRILTDVRKAADLGDWGARALLAHFYLEGLGPLESNNVLSPDADKAVELERMAAQAGQPWGIYDLGVAYEHGYGGVPRDVELAWAYFVKAAELGSPDAQMALASAYSNAGRLDDEKTMIQCAYQQGHGPAALALGVDSRVNKRFREALEYFQSGTRFGDRDCASALEQFFDQGFWVTTDESEKAMLLTLGLKQDTERRNRYQEIFSVLDINPDLKLSRLDQVLPLPPAPLPPWSGINDAVELESNAPPKY